MLIYRQTDIKTNSRLLNKTEVQYDSDNSYQQNIK